MDEGPENDWAGLCWGDDTEKVAPIAPKWLSTSVLEKGLSLICDMMVGLVSAFSECGVAGTAVTYAVDIGVSTAAVMLS